MLEGDHGFFWEVGGEAVKVPRWLSSQVEWLKLNLDGFALGKPGEAGFGFCFG